MNNTFPIRRYMDFLICRAIEELLLPSLFSYVPTSSNYFIVNTTSKSIAKALSQASQVNTTAYEVNLAVCGENI